MPNPWGPTETRSWIVLDVDTTFLFSSNLLNVVINNVNFTDTFVDKNLTFNVYYESNLISSANISFIV